MINVEDLGIVYQKPHYRIKRVNVQVFYESWTSMYQLEVKIRGEWIFITRDQIILDTGDGRSNALGRLKEKAKRFDSKLGYYKVYGRHNHPLEEFDFKEGGGFEDFTKLTPYGGPKRLWIFHGNHKCYSAVFRYFIWDIKLAGEIRRRLKDSKGVSKCKCNKLGR